MEVVFKDINVTINKKIILHDVCGVARPGDMLAVMGPSGSGKTTLLNTLAGRNTALSGEIMMDQMPVTKRVRRKMCYVLQQDIFFPTLSLRDTISFVANLRLPDKLTSKQKLDRAMEIIDDLDLTKCLDTSVGGMFVPGLSGGERKRANIACELLTDPQLLLLDEPTSGLDSHLAFNLMTILKRYTIKMNKTVITTIHQPSSQIFHMFDKVLLLCDGHVAYFGKGSNMLQHFSSIGLHCAPNYNPADFMLEMVKSDEKTVKRIIEAAYAAREGDEWPAQLCGATRRPSVCISEGEMNPALDVTKDSIPDKAVEAVSVTDSPSLNGTAVVIDETVVNNNSQEDVQFLGYTRKDPDNTDVTITKFREKDKAYVEKNEEEMFISEAKWPSSFWTQFTALTKRNFKRSRDTYLSKLEIIQSLFLAFYCGTVWFQLPRTEKTVNDRMGLIFFTAVYWGFSPMFLVTADYPSERDVINKERSSGMYRLSAYYCAKMLSEAPLLIVMPILFGTISYWMAGFNGIAAFFPYLLILLLSAFAAQSIGIFFSILISDFKTCLTTCAIIMLSSMLAGGYYQKNVPPWLSWIQYISFISHAFNGLVNVEFRNAPPFICAPANETAFPQCSGSSSNVTMTISGEDILQFNNFPDLLWLNIIILLIFLFVLRIAGYLLLRFVRKPHKT